jgi:hypothetical protein
VLRLVLHALLMRAPTVGSEVNTLPMACLQEGQRRKSVHVPDLVPYAPPIDFVID